MLCGLPLTIVVLAFSAIYAFNNPDPPECWAKLGSDEASAMRPAEDKSFYTNVAETFNWWFMGILIIFGG